MHDASHAAASSATLRSLASHKSRCLFVQVLGNWKQTLTKKTLNSSQAALDKALVL